MERYTVDPILVEVWKHLFSSIAEEMGVALERCAYSPNIKERLDHSCAVFDVRGRLLAQAAHIPVHLGAMPLMMQSLLASVRFEPGDMWMCNAPWLGGTHLPDITLVGAVFARDRTLLGYTANRAHHADVGGISPGSLPLSTELLHEGLVLPPVRLVRRGRIDQTMLDLVAANSRTPDERRGDLSAQIAANHVGARRLREIVDLHSLPEVMLRAEEIMSYSSRVLRTAIARLPDGDYRWSDMLDDDGLGNSDISIAVCVRVCGEEIEFDFTGSTPEVRGSLNATEAITRSACFYVLRCLLDAQTPMNAGLFEPVSVPAPAGSVVNASRRAAVAAGNVETSQRIVDVVLGALSLAAPELIPACSQGTMNNLMIGGWDSIRDRPFSYYETIAGGAGAGPNGPGESAIHTHMTNTRNTPIEALEQHYPLRVTEYSVRRASGGAGKHRGGDGVVREIELLAPATITVVSDRRRWGPRGANGGDAGKPGCNSIIGPTGVQRLMPGKFSLEAASGTRIRIETPGGGGWGEKVS